KLKSAPKTMNTHVPVFIPSQIINPPIPRRSIRNKFQLYLIEFHILLNIFLSHPFIHSSRIYFDVFKSMFSQYRMRDRSAIPCLTVDDKLLVTIQFIYVIGQCSHKNIVGTVYMILFILGVTTHVHDLYLRIPDIVFKLLNVNDFLLL